jgi:hypothetical protein
MKSRLISQSFETFIKSTKSLTPNSNRKICKKTKHLQISARIEAMKTNLILRHILESCNQ